MPIDLMNLSKMSSFTIPTFLVGHFLYWDGYLQERANSEWCKKIF